MPAARCCILLGLLLVPAVAAAQNLLIDAGPLPAGAARDVPAHRARAVTVDFDALPAPAPADGASVTFNLFDDTVLAGIVGKVEWTDRSLILSGRLADEPAGTFIAVRCEDALVAEVRSPARGLYEIRALGGGLHAVRRVNDSRFKPCAVAREHEVFAEGQAVDGPGTRENTDITVMVVYTEQARTGAGGQNGIDALIDLAINQANQVYANSQVQVNLQLAYRGMVVYTESGSASTDISRFSGGTDGFMDNVHAIRNCVKADMAALLVNNFNACGVGYLMTNVSTNFASAAFTVTDKDCISNYTFAHELGHNMGCHHDRDNAGGPGAYSYSYGYRTPNQAYRTVMAYSPGQRVAYFSNPDVSFLGFPMGVPIGQANEAHNAQSINNTRATVALFRTGYQPADFNQDGFVDGIDYDQFVAAFEAGDIAADFNGDGFVDGIDYDQFMTAFEAGC